MKCEECELSLAQDEISPDAAVHLAGCPNCRSLAAELRANARAMQSLREDAMPPVTLPKPRGVPWWRWSSAAAAVIITLSAAWWASRPEKPPHIVSVDVKVTGIVPTHVEPIPSAVPETLTPTVMSNTRTIAYAEPLRVKMLTPDPDVVIYWLVDTKGE